LLSRPRTGAREELETASSPELQAMSCEQPKPRKS
jgi:hypothetical protein